MARMLTCTLQVLEFSPVSHIDTSALHILEDMHKTYQGRGIQLCICNPGVSVMERLVLSGLADAIGRDFIFSSIHDCVNTCLDNMDTVECSMQGDPHEADESLASNEDLAEPSRDIESGAESSVGLVFTSDEVVAEIGHEVVNDGSTNTAKVTFSSIGTGQL